MKSNVVTQDAENHQALADPIKKIDFLESLYQGLADAGAGEGRSLDEVKAELRAKHGFQR